MTSHLPMLIGVVMLVAVAVLSFAFPEQIAVLTCSPQDGSDVYPLSEARR